MTDHRTARLTAWGAAAAIALVALTPMVLSAQSLAAWGRDALGLEGASPWLVPVSLDVAAFACIALALHATLRGDAGSAPKALTWVLVTGSAAANYRHGRAISDDAAVYFPLLPVLAMALVELGLRYLRRAALVAAGRTEAVLPHYRLARWAVAPRETLHAWRLAVTEGYSSPAEAVEAARRARAGEVPNVAESPQVLAADAGRLADLTKREQLLLAFTAVGEVSAPRALTWLARRGVEVSARYAHEVAAAERDRGPALLALDGGAS